MPTELALGADILLLGALDALMYRYLVTKGAARFSEL